MKPGFFYTNQSQSPFRALCPSANLGVHLSSHYKNQLKNTIMAAMTTIKKAPSGNFPDNGRTHIHRSTNPN